MDTLTRAMRFEFHKLARMQSAWILTAAAAIASIVPLYFGARYYRTSILEDTPQPLSEFDAVGLSNSQLTIGAIFLAILGVMFASFEFKGGAGRASSLAFPNRSVSFRAKMAVGAAMAAAFGAIVVPICFVVTQQALGPVHSVGLTDPGVARSLLGAMLYLVFITVFAMGLTYVFKSSAGAIGVLVPIMLIVSTILSNVPIGWLSKAAQFLPDLAGARLMRAYTPPDALLGPFTGGAVLLAWVGLFVGLGFADLRRRDIA